jgi:GTP pyrophosphokinase
VGTTPDADQARVAALVDGLAVRTAGLGLAAEVDGRVKSLWSLRKKMRRKGVQAGDVVDRLALRARVDTVPDCYALQSSLLAEYPAVAGELDDYIATPKPNGYRSLHLALVFPDAPEPVEVQIRTHDMHAAAEAGDAAHWRYKLA